VRARTAHREAQRIGVKGLGRGGEGEGPKREGMDGRWAYMASLDRE
jgi:hypothetical protein